MKKIQITSGVIFLTHTVVAIFITFKMLFTNYIYGVVGLKSTAVPTTIDIRFLWCRRTLNSVSTHYMMMLFLLLTMLSQFQRTKQLTARILGRRVELSIPFILSVVTSSHAAGSHGCRTLSIRIMSLNCIRST